LSCFLLTLVLKRRVLCKFVLFSIFTGLFSTSISAQFSSELGITMYDYYNTEISSGIRPEIPGNPILLEEKASPIVYYVNFEWKKNIFFTSLYNAWINAGRSVNYSKTYSSLGYRRKFGNWTVGLAGEVMHFYQYTIFQDEPWYSWEIPYDIALGLQVDYQWERTKIRFRREGIVVFDERTAGDDSPLAQWFFDFTGTIPLDAKSKSLKEMRTQSDHWLQPELSMGLELGFNELNEGGPFRLYPVWRFALVGGEEFQIAFSRSQWWSYAPFQNFISEDVLAAEINTAELGYRLNNRFDFWLGHSWNRKTYYLNEEEPERRFYYERAISPAVGYRHNQFTFQLRADIKYQYEPQAEVFNRGDVRFGVLYRFQ